MFNAELKLTNNAENALGKTPTFGMWVFNVTGFRKFLTVKDIEVNPSIDRIKS
jgi:hypothetical protein